MWRAVTGAIWAGFVIALGAASPAPAATRPPTAAGIERATDRFLATHPAPAGHSPPRPRAARVGEVLPANRVVSFYGAPQMGQTILGMHSPPEAARRLA